MNVHSNRTIDRLILSLRKVFIFLLLCFHLAMDSYAQFSEERVYYSHTANDPEWVKLMYSADADPGQVLKKYEEYYRQHQFQKNQHTQYLKRWLREINREYKPNESDADYLKRSLFLSSKRTNDEWQCIGPYDWDHDAAGRSYAPGSVHVYTVVQSLSHPDVLYCGTATAGIWKSLNRGNSWQPMSLQFLSKECTALAIDPANPEVVYAEIGRSVYKTINGGQNWNPTGNTSFQNLSLDVKDIVIRPNQSQTIFAATNNGLYRSVNGGAGWSNVLSGDVLEVEFHPTNRDTVYAVRRSGDATQFFRSVNGGTSFIQMTIGWPVITAGQEQKRTEIAVSPANPNNVYALLTGSANGGSGLYGVYISTNNGQSWTFACCGPQPAGPPSLTNPNLMGWDDNGLDDGGQYYYDLAFDVNPTNANHILVGGVNLWVSVDGGTSFTCPAKWSHPHKPNYVHADIHDIRYYQHTGEIWIASDGGIFVSTDNGSSYQRKVVGIEGTDFWGFGQGHWYGDVMLGGAYHNGTLLKEDNVYINDWLCTDGGDGTLGFVNPGFDRQVYSWFDIKHLKGNRNVAPETRNFQHKPNNSYITGVSNDLCFHPNYYATWYSGAGTRLWKTEDNGYTYTQLSNLGEDLASMDICRSNPDYIYVCTWSDWWGEKKIFRSVDGGLSWNNITPAVGLIPTNRWVPYQIRVHETNPLKIWIVRTSMYSDTNLNGQMVYTSEDGGASWTNISGVGMNGETPKSIMYQAGSNGGLYIGTSRAVYYKDNTMSDWQLINSGLPLATHSTRILPYYRKAMLRNATDRSVWERPFVHPSQPRAMISVEKKNYFCLKDTVRFVDYSILSDQNVSWSWHFPGAIQEYSSERAPKVLYSAPGTYDVSLTVQDMYGSDQITLYGLVKIEDQCSVDGVPGKSISLPGNNNSYVQSSGLQLNSNSMTISAWIKPNGIQSEYSGIVINDSGDAAGLNFRQNNMLAYHWPGGSWSWNSNLTVPQNEWSHVALVATPTSIKLYLNGIEATHNTNISTAIFNGFKIGSYRGWGGRYFNGQIDEVCIWNRSLSRNEIRELRHLTKKPDNDPTLVAYYQFNEDGSTVYDKSGNSSAVLSGNASKIRSTVPVGEGVSKRKNIIANGVTDFEEAGFRIWYSGGSPLPNGEIVVSKLNIPPDTIQFSNKNFDGGYWIINNYSTNQQFNNPDSVSFGNTGYISETIKNISNLLSLYSRSENSEGANWYLSHNGNQRLIPGIRGMVNLFNLSNFRRFGQFALLRQQYPEDIPAIWMSTNDNSPVPVEGGESISFYIDHQGTKALALPNVDEDAIEMLGEVVDGMYAYHNGIKRIILYSANNWHILRSIALPEVNFSAPSQEKKLAFSGSSSESAILGLDIVGYVQASSMNELDLQSLSFATEGMIFYNEDQSQLMLFDGHRWSAVLTEESTILPSDLEATIIEGFSFESSKWLNAVFKMGGTNKLSPIPKVSYKQISSPSEGLLCFDPQLKTLCFYDGANWRQVLLQK